jgi:hypothetical protein
MQKYHIIASMRNHKFVNNKANFEPQKPKTTQKLEPNKNDQIESLESIEDVSTDQTKVSKREDIFDVKQNQSKINVEEKIEATKAPELKVENEQVQSEESISEEKIIKNEAKLEEIKEDKETKEIAEINKYNGIKEIADNKEEEEEIQIPETTKKEKKGNAIYDFATRAKPANSLEDFSKQKKAEIKGKILNNKFSQNNSALIILVIVIICLTGLCAFTTYQIYKYEQQISLAKNTQNNSIDSVEKETWSGNGFEVKFNSALTNEFQKEKKDIDFEFLENKKGQVQSFLARDEIAGETYNTGIIIYSTDFDNKLGQKEFTEKVISKTNNEYLPTDQKISFKGDLVVTKLANKTKKDYSSIYPVVTSNHYYVIKVLTNGNNVPELEGKNKLIQEMINEIKLK